jgi:hypothetical protein
MAAGYLRHEGVEYRFRSLEGAHRFTSTAAAGPSRSTSCDTALIRGGVGHRFRLDTFNRYGRVT